MPPTSQIPQRANELIEALNEINEPPTYLALTFYLGCAPRTLCSAIKLLQRQGRLHVKRQPGKRNEYNVLKATS